MSIFIERLRDPIHGLIVFENEIDEIAWRLIDTPEFQRLRRIRQLGFSEFTFPGATHTRFSHSIGVYHNARRLMKVIEKFESNFDQQKEKVFLLAALLHDVGHGPFSHAFEKAREEIPETNNRGPFENHEKYTAKIIRNPSGEIYRALASPQLAEDIASVFDLDQPQNIYHAVVSSSFDADRLDFLVRDRYMTGTGAGAIDVDWLIDNLDKHEIPVGQDDDTDTTYIPTFVFKNKGRQAAEDFLLARYRLYTEVYLHKTTRGFEAILGSLLRTLADRNISASDLNLTDNHALVSFLRNKETISSYLELDDFSVWDAIKQMSKSTKFNLVAELSKRLLSRDHLHVLDVSFYCGNNEEQLKNFTQRIEKHAENELGISIFKDNASANLYSAFDGEAKKVHKVIRVLDGNGGQKEINKFDDTIISSKLTEKIPLIRYYFLTKDAKQKAEKAMRGR